MHSYLVSGLSAGLSASYLACSTDGETCTVPDLSVKVNCCCLLRHHS